MPKVYKGESVLIEPPEIGGWATLLYSDGYKCQVAMSKFGQKEGKDVIWFYLMPYEATIKKFGIDTKKDLNRSGYTWKSYPIEMIRLLNIYDPARRIYFCLIGYNGMETENTSWFKGMEQVTEIIKLKKEIRNSKVYNSRLLEENLLLRTNVQKYIKENVEGLIKPIMPTIKSLIAAEPTGEGRER